MLKWGKIKIDLLMISIDQMLIRDPLRAIVQIDPLRAIVQINPLRVPSEGHPSATNSSRICSQGLSKTMKSIII
jgi:hypothetical protein